MVLKAIYALHILYSSIDIGLLFARFIISPKYLNSLTFFNSSPLHLKSTSIFIYIAFVLDTLIYSPLSEQNLLKALSICCRPSALCDSNTASSAKARKKTCKVAISKIYRVFAATICSLKYFNRYGYT
jgi:hypothetical protein